MNKEQLDEWQKYMEKVFFLQYNFGISGSEARSCTDEQVEFMCKVIEKKRESK